MSIAEISKQFHADHRGNCAMSVAYGYARATGKSEAEAMASAEMFRNFGGGKAPNGSCGALYAAKMMQDKQTRQIPLPQNLIPTPRQGLVSEKHWWCFTAIQTTAVILYQICLHR